VWLPVPQYEGFYEVSDDGEVRSVGRKVKCYGGFRTIKGKVLKPSLSDDGYHVVSISRGDHKQETVHVHRIVLLAFVGPCPEGMETRHDDGSRTNNRLSNICWGTPEENWIDRKRHGRVGWPRYGEASCIV